jgi:hypothetical protein
MRIFWSLIPGGSSRASLTLFRFLFFLNFSSLCCQWVQSVVGSVLLPSRQSRIMPELQNREELELRRRNLPEYVTSLSLSLSLVFLCFFATVLCTCKAQTWFCAFWYLCFRLWSWIFVLHFKVDMWIEMSSGHECRNLQRYFCRSNFWLRLLGLGFRLFISLSEHVSESRKTHLAVNSEMSDQGMLTGRCVLRVFFPPPWSPCCLTDFPLCVFCSDYQTISLQAVSDLIWNFSYFSGLVVVD